MADYVTNFDIDNGNGVIKNVLIRENFIDVNQEGIKNNGSDITDSLNTLIAKYKNSGVTFLLVLESELYLGAEVISSCICVISFVSVVSLNLCIFSLILDFHGIF